MACQVLPFLGAKVLQKLIKPLLSSKSNKEAKGRQYTAVHRKLGKKGMGRKNAHRKQWEQDTNSQHMLGTKQRHQSCAHTTVLSPEPTSSLL